MSENKNDKDKIEAIEIEDINSTTDDKSPNPITDEKDADAKEKKEQEDTNKEKTDSKENELDKDIEIIDYTDNTVESIDFESDDIDLEKLGGVKSPADKKKSVLREIWSYVSIICGALIVAYLINTFILINAVVPTSSMENTIMTGDRIFGYRLAYGLNMDVFGHEISKKWKDPERFDIVIFKYPDDESQLFIKRIIGLPGDKVEIKDGKVYINDSETPLDDSFVSETPLGSFGPYEVPENCYFMMGDNRNSSLDSRYWKNTYVAKDKILAKVIFRYYDGFNGKIDFSLIH